MPITQSAFGQDKVTQDYSLLHAICTADIPTSIMRTIDKVNGVVTDYDDANDSPYASSINGELTITAPPNFGDETAVFTQRHPRIHPDRGHHFAASAFDDTWGKNGYEIEYGFFNISEETLEILDGITFMYSNNIVYARAWSSGQLTYNQPIAQSGLDGMQKIVDPDLASLPLKKGHLGDIIAQWRGVGDIGWASSSTVTSAPEFVHKWEALNRRDNLTTSNPALHGGFIVRNKGIQGQVRSGCLDITSEGGGDEIQQFFQFANEADVTTPASGDKVLLTIHVPEEFKGKLNTRDSQVYRVTVTSDKKAVFKVWKFRRYDRLTKGVLVPLAPTDWQDGRDGVSIQYIGNSNSLITGFDTTGLKPRIRRTVQANQVQEYEFPSPRIVPFRMSHADTLVVTGNGPTANMSAEIDIGEEI